MNNKYHKYKKYDRTLKEYVNLGRLKCITFNEESFNDKTKKGDEWICKNSHKFKASYSKVFNNKWICPRCIDIEYEVNINVSMIRAMMRTIFNIDRQSIDFNRRSPTPVKKMKPHKRKLIDGYSSRYNTGFILVKPQCKADLFYTTAADFVFPRPGPFYQQRRLI